MKKYRKLYFIFILLIVIFTASLINKTLQNDTFFTIKMGNYILQNGLTSDEPLTYHTNLKFVNHRWLFDVIIAVIYNISGLYGIYFFTIFITCIIGITLFSVLIKRKNNIILSFITTILAIYFSKNFFTARAQIFSYLIFIVEIYLIESLLETKNKRYCIYIFLLSILLANVHASVWPMYLVFFLPYIAEFIFEKTNLAKFSEKLYSESISIKLLLITLLLSFLGGVCTPITFSTYTDTFKVMNGISKNFIAELQPVILVNNSVMLFILFLCGFTFLYNKQKIKVSDFCMVLGTFLLGLMGIRNTAFLYLIGTISLTRIITTLENFDSNITEITDKLNANVLPLIFLGYIILMHLLNSDFSNSSKKFIDDTTYPIEACTYIKENIDVKNMRIFNHFNFGSYLEFCDIPAFIDSRSGIFCKEFNNTSILEDWYNAFYGNCDYKEVFKKYNITHALLYKDEIISQYIDDDSNYKKIYEDDYFVLYEKEI